MKHTILPWMDPISGGRIVIGFALVLIAYNIVEYFLKRKSLSLRRGQLALLSNTAWTLCLNTIVWTIAYWQWALILSLGIGGVFIVIIRNELKAARDEEMDGAVGINPEIRQIRSELFADRPIEEQLEYKKSYRPMVFWWWFWLPLMVAIPFFFVLLLEALGAGDYLFFVVYFK